MQSLPTLEWAAWEFLVIFHVGAGFWSMIYVGDHRRHWCLNFLVGDTQILPVLLILASWPLSCSGSLILSFGLTPSVTPQGYELVPPRLPCWALPSLCSILPWGLL